jgi:hypothetical protein
VSATVGVQELVQTGEDCFEVVQAVVNQRQV